MGTIKERAAEYAHKYRREVRDLSGELAHEVRRHGYAGVLQIIYVNEPRKYYRIFIGGVR